MNGLSKFTALALLQMVISCATFSQDKYRAESDANLRSGAGTDYPIITTVKVGEDVIFVDSVRGNWLKVRYGTKEGYISRKLFSLVPASTPAASLAQPIATTPAPPVDSTSTTQKWLIVLACVLGTYFFIAGKAKKRARNEVVWDTVPVKEQASAPSTNSNPQRKVSGQPRSRKEGGLPTSKNGQQKAIEQKTMSSTKESLPKEDAGVIDISNVDLDLTIAKEAFTGTERRVPYWEHQYIYSFDNLRWANDEQRAYYEYFKNSFLAGKFPNIGENTNYAFLLLFDLIRRYESHRNLNQIQNELDVLALHYPRTKIYTYTTLAKTLQKLDDHDSLAVLEEKGLVAGHVRYGGTSDSYTFTADFWGLGTRFKQKLKLENHEIDLLNRLWHTQNAFSDIEFCHIEIVKLFLRTIKFLKNHKSVTSASFDIRLNETVDLILIKHFHFAKSSYNYKSSIDSVKNEIYNLIYKICENSVRTRFEHKRKLSEDFYVTKADIKEALDRNILTPVNYAILQSVTLIESPDRSTEIELNTRNPSRWKNKFEQYLTAYRHAPELFAAQIYQLGQDNINNPSVENIFFEASKVMSAVDKKIALQLYIHYIYADLNSETFDHRKLTKTIQRSLFKNEDQIKDFEILINELIKTKDLQVAHSRLNELFLPKRRKLQIDKDLIREVQTQHSETVELLNGVLQDDEQEMIGPVPKQGENVILKINEAPEHSLSSYYISHISFSAVHFSFLQLFEKNNFLLSHHEIIPFAKSNGVFQNSLIDNINELCYELFDDNLIEQEDLNYSINPSHYKRLLQQ